MLKTAIATSLLGAVLALSPVLSQTASAAHTKVIVTRHVVHHTHHPRHHVFKKHVFKRHVVKHKSHH